MLGWGCNLKGLVCLTDPHMIWGAGIPTEVWDELSGWLIGAFLCRTEFSASISWLPVSVLFQRTRFSWLWSCTNNLLRKFSLLKPFPRNIYWLRLIIISELQFDNGLSSDISLGNVLSGICSSHQSCFYCLLELQSQFNLKYIHSFIHSVLIGCQYLSLC